MILDGDVKNYKYYIIHCDAEWNPSVISDYEYEKGFSDDNITDYTHSLTPGRLTLIIIYYFLQKI